MDFVRSLRIPLDLRGVGSTDRTGSVSLEGTQNEEMRVKWVKRSILVDF